MARPSIWPHKLDDQKLSGIDFLKMSLKNFLTPSIFKDTSQPPNTAICKLEVSMKSIVMLTLGSAVLTPCGNANSLENQMLLHAKHSELVVSETSAYSTLTEKLEALGVIKHLDNPTTNNQCGGGVSCVLRS